MAQFDEAQKAIIKLGELEKRWKRQTLGSLIAITILGAVLGLAWSTVWTRGDKIKSLEAQVATLEADKAELQGDLLDIQQTPIGYFLLYRRATLARFERIEPRWDEILQASWEASKKHGVPAEIIIGVIELESGFNPDAIGLAGEVGLMQVYPRMWPQFDTARGFEIDYNVDFGCRIFAGCLKEAKGDIKEALRLYNGRGVLPEGILPYADRVLNGRTMRMGGKDGK